MRDVAHVTDRMPVDPMVRVRGAREHNLKNVDVVIPREQLVVFTGISGSGKSSLAFGTLYAEAQRRYLESVAPYARRLFDQMDVPKVDDITGLPPAVALQQQRGTPTTRSSVGSVTTLSNLLRMLYSRAGTYPSGAEMLHASAFSPNTPEGACNACQGFGRVYDATEATMVPDPALSIRERAVAAWPPAWHGQNLRDILVTLGYDIDVPWRNLPKKDRNFILFTEKTPTVPVYAGWESKEVRAALKRKDEPSYMGTFTGARRYLLRTFATTQSAMMKRRVQQYLVSTPCAACDGKRLAAASLQVSFAGHDIAALGQLSLDKLFAVVQPYVDAKTLARKKLPAHTAVVAQRICADLSARLAVLLELGLGYLSLERTTPTLSPGELQRLRLGTQVRSNLFGVVYVLDEPSAGLHPADTQTLLRALGQLRAAGNSLFVVEHEIDVIRAADWLVDVGPAAGEHGGEVLYSGPPEGLQRVAASQTRRYLFAEPGAATAKPPREARGWLELAQVSCHNVSGLDVRLPLGVLTCVTGISGSGKSTLVSRVLVDLVARRLEHHDAPQAQNDPQDGACDNDDGDTHVTGLPQGTIRAGMQHIKRLVVVDQKQIGRTPRSNLATYTGLLDPVRKLFADTREAKARKFDAGHFSFNVAKGRCDACEGEGFIAVELLFLASAYAPCSVCGGTRYKTRVLEVRYRGKHMAEVLAMTVDAAATFFADVPQVARALDVLQQVGLGYLRLGQPATELSGGEAQRIKLATELQRRSRGESLYVLDEPTTGLHPADVERLRSQLHNLVDAGNTVVVVEHDMQLVASADWMIDMGPGAGESGGRIVVQGTPRDVAASKTGRTAPFLGAYLT